MIGRARQLGVLALLATIAGGAHAIPPRSIVELQSTSEAQAGRAHMDLMSFLLQRVENATLLRGYRIAILAADGVDGFDLEVPHRFLAERGASVQVLAPRAPHVLQAAGSGARLQPKTTLSVLDPSGEQRVAGFDRFVDQAGVADYDAVYLPGNRAGSTEPIAPQTIAFLQEAARAGKPIFATGNAPLILLEAGLLDGRRATGEPATLLRLALSSAIAVDAPLVSAGAIHTSRDAFDIPALIQGLVDALLARPAPGR
jgi:protease I